MKRPLAISTCWNSARHDDGYTLLSELAGLGFNEVELGHGIRYSLWPGILKAVQEKVVRIISLHNFCPLPMGYTRPNPNCYEFSDHRATVRARAVRSTKETIQQAVEVGATRVVLHLGSTGQPTCSHQLESLLAKGRFGSRQFVRLKINAVMQHEERFIRTWSRVRAVLDELVPFAAERGVKLGCECREEIEEFPMEGAFTKILDSYPEETLGYWHDFGHAARKEALGLVDHLRHFQAMAPRMVGCHIHDFKYPNRDHRPLGTGVIRFETFWPSLPAGVIPTLELSPRVTEEAIKECLIWWKVNGPDAV
ncbi:MAG: sugar phosphate isomerase/epimerase family protein [Candidatus Methylacidiphilales bacterium]